MQTWEYASNPAKSTYPRPTPFKNDLLSRKKPAEVLTHLVGALEGPLRPGGGRRLGGRQDHVFLISGRNISAIKNFPLSSSMPGRRTMPEIPLSRSRPN